MVKLIPLPTGTRQLNTSPIFTTQQEPHSTTSPRTDNFPQHQKLARQKKETHCQKSFPDAIISIRQSTYRFT